MNMQGLAGVIRKEHGFTKAESGRILETVLGGIRKEVKRGGTVRLRNFGTFRRGKIRGKVRAEFRTSRNFFADWRPQIGTSTGD